MKPLYRSNLLWLCLLYFVSSVAVADTVVAAPETAWKCSASDKENKHWTAQGNFERMAATNALDACKKLSQIPGTCRLDHEQCSSTGPQPKPAGRWRCSALDKTAALWIGKTFPVRDNAALGAKDYCQKKSGLPETCYVNLITCRNVDDAI